MIAAIICLLAASASVKDPVKFFDTRVAPVLTRRCLGCHNEDLKDGGVSFLDRESLLKRASRGVPVVPGDPERSVLIQAIRHDGDVRMPPGPKLPPREIAILTEWVRSGAAWGTKLRRSR